MRSIKIILLAVMAIVAASACSQSKSKDDMEKKNVLVVFFSATGTTKHVAEELARIAGADLCEIVPAQPYTSADLNWNDKRSRSSIEMANPQARPAVKSIGIDIKKYDRIFLGYPIWWDLAPRVVNTFIESNDMTGKKHGVTIRMYPVESKENVQDYKELWAQYIIDVAETYRFMASRSYTLEDTDKKTEAESTLQAAG